MLFRLFVCLDVMIVLRHIYILFIFIYLKLPSQSTNTMVLPIWPKSKLTNIYALRNNLTSTTIDKKVKHMNR